MVNSTDMVLGTVDALVTIERTIQVDVYQHRVDDEPLEAVLVQLVWLTQHLHDPRIGRRPIFIQAVEVLLEAPYCCFCSKRWVCWHRFGAYLGRWWVAADLPEA
jgi:hypothetical protein